MIKPDTDQQVAAHHRRTRNSLMRRNGTDWLIFLVGGGLIVWGVIAGAGAMRYNWQW
ncbi:MAG: hypothetical protein ACWA5A_11090 [Marinibacterium sp.]